MEIMPELPGEKSGQRTVLKLIAKLNLKTDRRDGTALLPRGSRENLKMIAARIKSISEEIADSGRFDGRNGYSVMRVLKAAGAATRSGGASSVLSQYSVSCKIFDRALEPLETKIGIDPEINTVYVFVNGEEKGRWKIGSVKAAAAKIAAAMWLAAEQFLPQ